MGFEAFFTSESSPLNRSGLQAADVLLSDCALMQVTKLAIKKKIGTPLGHTQYPEVDVCPDI